MNILVINGSPHVKGTSALLMEEFIRGAQAMHGWTSMHCL